VLHVIFVFIVGLGAVIAEFSGVAVWLCGIAPARPPTNMRVAKNIAPMSAVICFLLAISVINVI